MNVFATVNAAARRPRILVIRPQPLGGGSSGDEVMYRRSLNYLARAADLETVELQAVPQLRKLLNLLLLPAELTRYRGAANIRRISQRVSTAQFDTVLFFNEVTFPMIGAVRGLGCKPVLVAHNVHSVVARTDPSPLIRATTQIAARFERRTYGDPEVILVCISQTDVDGLRLVGVNRNDIRIAPPGAPNSFPLAIDSKILPELILTGSYGWWRKRRDLRKLVSGLKSLKSRIFASDVTALKLLGKHANATRFEDINWSGGLRFGIISDRFLGGFKLKALEYIARNCVVVAHCDLSREFRGLPYADEMVLHVDSLLEVQPLIDRMLVNEVETMRRFQVFQRACLLRYAWDTCLHPLGEAVTCSIMASSLYDPELTLSSTVQAG